MKHSTAIYNDSLDIKSSDFCLDGNERHKKIVIFDMDSTLIDAESIDELAKVNGVGNSVSEITEQAMKGELDYADALNFRVKLLKGLNIKKAKEAMDKMPIMTGAHELIEFIKSKGFMTAIISGGFTISANRIGSLFNIDEVITNELIVDNGHLTGMVVGPLLNENSKEFAFEKIIRKYGIHIDKCIVIGDGANDIGMFKKTKYAIAFNSKPILQKYANAIVEKKDLREVIPIIESFNLV